MSTPGFSITDEQWAKDVQTGVGTYMDALTETLIDDEAPDQPTLSGDLYCGCDVCYWREALCHLIPVIIDGYRSGKIVLDDNGKRFSDFDEDLRIGEAAQDSVKELLRMSTVEIKADRRWVETGNLFIETQCRSREGNWYPSNLAETKAPHYSFHLSDMVALTIRTDILRALVAQEREVANDMEPNPTKGVLVDFKRISDFTRTFLIREKAAS